MLLNSIDVADVERDYSKLYEDLKATVDSDRSQLEQLEKLLSGERRRRSLARRLEVVGVFVCFLCRSVCLLRGGCAVEKELRSEVESKLQRSDKDFKVLLKARKEATDSSASAAKDLETEKAQLAQSVAKLEKELKTAKEGNCPS